jgi:hypothetical protein
MRSFEDPFGKQNKHESATISAIVIANDHMANVESACLLFWRFPFICSVITIVDRRDSMVAWTRVWILLLALVARSAVYCIDRM